MSGTGGGEPAARPGENWQEALRRYVASLTDDQAEQLRSDAVRELDRATLSRQLHVEELARLSALADYLAPRVEKRQGAAPPTMAEGVLMGLIAGYQLAV